MQCPKCEQALHPRRFGEVVVDQCPVCQGVWLDLGELPVLRQQQNTHYSQGSGETAVYNVLSAPCPHCGGDGHMTRIHDLARPEIVMDTCPVCYGIWLDGGELDALTAQSPGLTLKEFVREMLD